MTAGGFKTGRWLPLLLVVGCLGLIAGANAWIYHRSWQILDDDLGLRLTGIAGLLVESQVISGDDLFRERGRLDPFWLDYLDPLLQRIQQSHELDAILLLDPDTYSVAYTSRPQLYPAGGPYPHLVTHTPAIVASVIERRPAASPTIRVGGGRGVYLKSGFAAVHTVLQDELVAVLVVEASADFLEVLTQLGRGMVSVTLLATVLLLLLAGAYLGLQRKTDRARLALERQDRMVALGRMASQVAHEIRNPVGIIKYSAERLGRWLERQKGGRRSPDPELIEMVTYIREETRRLQDMPERYLTYAGRGRMQPQPIRVGEVVHEAAQGIERMSLPEGVTLVVDLEPDLPEIEGDPDLLRQALINLGSNALEAVGVQGILTFIARIEPQSRQLQIGVRDTGPGIPDRLKEKVFEAFYSGRTDGNGMGLYIVADIARAHGGTARVEDAPEGGTMASLLLPLRQGE